MILWSFFPGIDHGHQADGAGVDDSEGNDRFLAQDQHVERVIVIGQRLRDEPVVGGIVNSRVKDAVEFDQATGLIQFVLHAGTEGNLDDGVELRRQFVAGSDIVPRMNHKRLL